MRFCSPRPNGILPQDRNKRYKEADRCAPRDLFLKAPTLFPLPIVCCPLTFRILRECALRKIHLKKANIGKINFFMKFLNSKQKKKGE